MIGDGEEQIENVSIPTRIIPSNRLLYRRQDVSFSMLSRRWFWFHPECLVDDSTNALYTANLTRRFVCQTKRDIVLLDFTGLSMYDTLTMFDKNTSMKNDVNESDADGFLRRHESGHDEIWVSEDRVTSSDIIVVRGPELITIENLHG